MRVLVACEFSGKVRDAFTLRGHTAVSCDYRSPATLGFHYKGNVLDILDYNWDLMIAHPPCTFLTVASSRDWGYTWDEQQEALNLVDALMKAPIPRICIENPPGLISTLIRRPNQYIHPYMFGHPYTKRTGLWLQGLPKLRPTNNVWEKPNEYPIIESWNVKTRREWMRSETFQGIADAMAEQWGSE
jgi:hypothetical protein